MITKSLSIRSDGLQLLGGIFFTNLYLSVCIYYVSIMSSWRLGFLSWHIEYVSSEHLIHMHCQAEVFYSWDMQNCGAIAVIESMAYITIVKLFDDIPHPLLPWGSGRFKGGRGGGTPLWRLVTYFAYITARVHQMVMQQWHAATITRHSYTLAYQFLTDLQMLY